MASKVCEQCRHERKGKKEFVMVEHHVFADDG